MVNPKPCHRARDAVRSAHQPLREGEKSGAISMGWLWGAEQRLGYLLTPVVVCSSASWFLVKTKSSLTCSWVDLSLLQGRAISSGAEVYTMLWRGAETGMQGNPHGVCSSNAVYTDLYNRSCKSAVLQDGETCPTMRWPVEGRRQEISLANFLLSYGESAGNCGREEFVKFT